MSDQASAPSDLLIVEDSALDVELVAAALQQGGVPAILRRVEDEAAFRAEIGSRLPDAILSDWTLPRFSGRAAMEIARAVCPEVPFIFVSGTLQETMAIDALRQGATDYVYKHQLDLLAPILSRALAEARQRRLRREAELAALRSSSRYAALLDAVPEGVFECDDLGQLLWANERWSELTGYPLAEGLGFGWQKTIVPEDRPAMEAFVAATRGHGMAGTIEHRIRRPDGEMRWIYVQVAPLPGDAGQVAGWVGTMGDITERKRAEADLQLAATVFQASDQGIIITDARQRILVVNPFFCQVTGYRADEVLGRNPNVLRSDVQEESFYQQMWGSIQTTGHWQGEITNRRKDGTLYPEWLSISAVRDAAGAITHYVGLFSDLTARKAMDDRLRHLAHYDALTDLPNRTLFMDRFEQALLTAQRFDRSVALLWLDLVRFRVLNDTLGHRVGDAVLVEVAHRLEAQARSGDTVARLSADEFVLVMANLGQESDVIGLVQRIIESVAAPMRVAENEIGAAVNIGISLFPKDGTDAAALLKGADIALQRAKAAGRDSFRFFAAAMDVDAERRLKLESDLRMALARGELELHYQPQIELASGRVNGIEALLRWNHPVMGPISPVEFIPLAEETGMIHSIGEWTLLEGCRQAKHWLDSGVSGLPMAINLSARQFHRPDLVDLIRNTLAQTGLPAGQLELELTESAFIGDVAEAAVVVKKIKALGVLLALDDFGTGYSSLAYLSGFPFDKIKIDQSFVRDITTNPVNAAIATATIAMGRSLNLVVLAEGVETDAQMHFLRTRQCESMQGHLFSKALSAAELGSLLGSGMSLKVGAGATPHETLLLLDDEPNILSALKRLLRRDGYDILTAESPDIAFDLLARHEVQVIVSDQRMPEMNGTEFLSRVKQMYPETIRIVLSGYTDLDSVTDAINRGAIYRFLTKPWDDEILRSQIREAFRVARGLTHI